MKLGETVASISEPIWCSILPFIASNQSNILGPEVVYVSFLSRDSQIDSLDLESAWTATNPPVRKKALCLSASVIRFKSTMLVILVSELISTKVGSNLPFGLLKSIKLSVKLLTMPRASVLGFRLTSLKPVPGLAAWLSLDPIKPNLNLFGYSGFVKSVIARIY